MVSCAHGRMAAAFDAKDWTGAALEARRGLRDVPDSPELKEALAAALHNRARDLVAAHDCPAARALALEVRALGMAEQAASVLRACPGP
jgi:hypothetical protein